MITEVPNSPKIKIPLFPHCGTEPMIFKRLSKILVVGVLTLSLLVSGCSKTSSTASPPAASVEEAVAATPVSGGKLNQFFPKGQGEYKVTFRQEKQGFAQAKLSQGGSDVALLSINDIANNPSAAQKFNDSSKAIAGYPAVNQGKSTTAILVGNRYQVKVKSDSESFTESNREEWLQKFNLNSLARLQ